MVPFVNSVGAALPAYRQAGVAALFWEPIEGLPYLPYPPLPWQEGKLKPHALCTMLLALCLSSQWLWEMDSQTLHVKKRLFQNLWSGWMGLNDS